MAWASMPGGADPECRWEDQSEGLPDIVRFGGESKVVEREIGLHREAAPRVDSP